MVLDGVRRVIFFLLGFGGLIYFSLVLAYFLSFYLVLLLLGVLWWSFFYALACIMFWNMGWGSGVWIYNWWFVKGSLRYSLTDETG